MNKEEFQGVINRLLNNIGETSPWHLGYKIGLWESSMLARQLDDCIVDENEAYLLMRGISNLPDKEFDTFWDVLKGKRSLVVPQFVADWYEKNKEFLEYSIYSSTVSIHDKSDASEKLNEFEDWLNTSANNGYEVLTHMKYGYKVEEVPSWEIPLPGLLTSDGRIQFLSYDSVEKRYFASRRNKKLKQTYTKKQLKEVPYEYYKYAVELEVAKTIKGEN